MRLNVMNKFWFMRRKQTTPKSTDRIYAQIWIFRIKSTRAIIGNLHFDREKARPGKNCAPVLKFQFCKLAAGGRQKSFCRPEFLHGSINYNELQLAATRFDGQVEKPSIWMPHLLMSIKYHQSTPIIKY